MGTELALKLVSDHDLTVWNRTAVASLQEQQKKGHGDEDFSSVVVYR